MSQHDLEELSLWHDILEDAINGHDEGLKCPECGGPVEAEADEYQVRVQCTKCGKWIEAVMR